MGGLMKKSFLYFISIILLGGCATPSIAPDESIPYPVSMALFPILDGNISIEEVTVNALFYVLADGTVEEVALTDHVISPEWDAAAIDSMKKWKFSKLPSNMDPDGIWLRRVIKVQFEEPNIMDLVFITLDDSTVADSLYSTFNSRSNFIRLFEQSDIHKFTYEFGIERDQNIAKYPEHVRLELRKLKINNYTRPIRLNNRFLIFQRIETQLPNS
jgi:hypothetical protein